MNGAITMNVQQSRQVGMPCFLMNAETGHLPATRELLCWAMQLGVKLLAHMGFAQQPGCNLPTFVV